MKSEKVKHLKEKQIEKKAIENFNNSSYVQNPIEAKLIAFQKTKKEIDIKDLL